jgi:ubiquitin carboxyl-terminal hydrolase 1
MSNDHHQQPPVLLKNNRQIVTEKLHELYQNLHRNESIDSSDSFHAGNFLQSIQDVSSIFEGNQQQDAHEV